MNRQTHTKTYSDTAAAYRAEIEKKGRERLQALEQIEGIWKEREPDPVKELEEMRKEWERNLP